MGRKSHFFLTCLLAGFFLVPEVYGWTQWRGDSERSGQISGALDLETPGVRWRSSAGGVLANDRVLDVDGDQASDLITVEGGQVVARGVQGELLWDTPNLLAKRVEEALDVNGDGVKELLVRRRDSIFFLSVSDGSLLWESSLEAPLEQIGALTWADLDGNGTIEILLSDQAMNASKPYLTGAVHVYGFDDGFEEVNPRFSTESETRDYEVGRSLLAADVDGDGNREIIVTGKRAVYVYSGIDGTLVGGTDPESLVETAFLGISDLHAKDLDGDGVPEIVVFTDTDFVGDATRQITVVERAEDGGIQVRWQLPVPDPVFGSHHWPFEPFTQPDSDGQVKIWSNAYVPNEGWVCRLINGESGEVESTFANRRALRSVAWVEGKESFLVSTSAVQEPGLYEEHRVLALEEGEWTESPVFTGNIVNLDEDEPGAFVLVLDENGDGWGDAIERWSYPQLEVLSRSELGVLSIRGGVSDGTAALLAYEPLGRLSVLNRETLELLNDQDGDGTPDLQVGGYGIGRVVAAGSTVVHGRAGGRIVVLDGQTGDPTQTPDAIAEFIGSMNQQPVLFNSGQGLAIIILTQESVTRSLQVKAYTTEGDLLWTSNLGGAGGIYGVNREILVEDLDEDGVDDIILAVDESVQPSNHRVFAINGSNGVALWQPQLIETPGGGIGQLSVDKETGTLFLTGNKVLYEWDGRTGFLIRETTNVAGHYYGRVFPVNLDGEGGRELVLIGTHKGAIALNEDRTERWALEMGSSTRATGVVAQYDGETRLGLAQFQSPVFWILDESGELVSKRVIAFGQVYDSLEAAPEGSEKAFLNEALFVEDINGEGIPVFLLTSTDGYLYAVQTNGDLLWARTVEGAAGAPAVFDADGDGVLELLVPSQTGDVVAFDQTALTAPGWVYEVAAPGSTEDVDIQESCSTMHLAWEPVIGATGYRIALYSGNGTFISLHQSEGSDAGTVLEGLSLKVGGEYFVRVSATVTDENGTVAGPYQVSDGVAVEDQSDPLVSFFTVSPFALVPAQGTSVVNFSVSGTDSKGLESYRISVRGDDGSIRKVWEGAIQAKEFELDLVWDGRRDDGEFASGGLQVVRLVLRDLAGKEVTEERDMFLCTSPNLYDSQKGICYAPPEDIPVEAEGEPSGPPASENATVLTVDTGEEGTPIGLPLTPSGCNCQTTGNTGNQSSAALGVLTVFMLLWWFRRREELLHGKAQACLSPERNPARSRMECVERRD